MRITPDDILEYASLGEHPWLDFKEFAYRKDSTADLIHDVICMANVICEGSRYLLLGVSNDGEIKGLSDPLLDHAVWSQLRAGSFNTALDVDIYEVTIDEFGSPIRIGIIEVRPSQRQPLYLTKDFKRRGKTVRAGVAYLRDGTNNTPINGCPSDAQLEALWERRFELHLKPLAQGLKLIQDVDAWINFEDPANDELGLHYHEAFPEFTLATQVSPRHIPGEFWEPWIERIENEFKKSQARQSWVYLWHLKYHATVLKSGLAMCPRHCMMPFPECSTPEADDWTIRVDTTDYFVCAITSRDRWDANHETDRLGWYDEQILRDHSVMFSDEIFHLERRLLAIE